MDRRTADLIKVAKITSNNEYFDVVSDNRWDNFFEIRVKEKNDNFINITATICEGNISYLIEKENSDEFINSIDIENLMKLKIFCEKVIHFGEI